LRIRRAGHPRDEDEGDEKGLQKRMVLLYMICLLVLN
jgi:hypothetical protein